MQRSDAEFYACPIPFPTTRWRARGVRAVDGDTIVVRLDKGWMEGATLEIRLAGIDTWERLRGSVEERALGELARRFADLTLASVWLQLTTAMDPEKYGRVLGHIDYWDAGTGQLVDFTEQLDRLGFRKGTPVRARQVLKHRPLQYLQPHQEVRRQALLVAEAETLERKRTKRSRHQ